MLRSCLLVLGALLLVACPTTEDPPITGTADAIAETLTPDTGSPDVPEDTADAVADVADTADATPDITGDASADGAEDSSEGDADVAGPDADVSLPDAGPDVVLPPGTFSLSCTTTEDCKTPCAVGSCNAGTCEFATPQQGCVVVDEATGLGSCIDSGTLHPTSDCLFCNPNAQVVGFTPFLFAEDFETNDSGFTVVNLSGSTAVWSRSTVRAGNGAASLYFGDPATQTYDVGEQRAWGRALSEPLTVPAGVNPQLSFQVWLESERLKAHDFLRVIVFYGANEEKVVWHSDDIGGTTDGEFVPVSATLTDFAGQQIQLAFEFDSVDGLINAYEGAYIDGIRLTTGCCAAANDCDDGNGCTVDSCPEVGGLCTYEEDTECCNSTSECDDGNSCTTDFCSGPGGECQHFQVPNCCKSNLECNDDDPCTEDSCDLQTETCSYQPLCCEVDGDCNDGDSCTVGSCVEGQCAYEFTCCIDNAECDDGDYCTIDTCDQGDCTHVVASLPGCCQPDIALLDFELPEQVDGWVFDPPNGGVGWQVTDQVQVAGQTSVLYYGNPATQNFDSNGSNSGNAVSTGFELPDGYAVNVTFKYQFEGESSTSYDQFRLFVETGNDSIEIVNKGDINTGAGWKTITRDLSWAGGQTVSFRFNFNSVDSISNTGFGMVIDDFEITSTCEAKTCSSAAQCPAPDKCTTGFCNDNQCSYEFTCCADSSECDDQDVCTNDACVQGVCQFSPIPNCCETDAECDDNNACTTDTCPTFGGTCSNAQISGCCLSNSDCNDGDQCTVDTCNDTNTCDYVNVCCASDAECDDGDDVCTIDACVDQFCQFTPTGADGCCVSQPVQWDFEVPVNFTFTGSDPNCKWQIDAGEQTFSGTQTLFYADIAAGNFACGDTNGTATSPTFTLSPGVPYTLNWKLYMDTETSTSYDQLTVYVIDSGGVSTQVWDKSQLNGTNNWQDQSADLSQWAGETISVMFEFDSIDSIGNSGDGTFVDDVTVDSPCVNN